MAVSGGEIEAVLRVIALNQTKATLAEIKADTQALADAMTTMTAKQLVMAREQMQINASNIADFQNRVATATAAMKIPPDFGTQFVSAKESMAALGQTTDATSESTSRFTGMMDRMLIRMAALYAVRAVFNEISKSVSDASKLEALNKQFDISVETLQTLQIAGEKTGVSFGSITTAFNALEKNLVEGSKNTKTALDDLGLSSTHLASLSSEARNNEVMLALQMREATNSAMAQKDAFALLGTDGLRPLIKDYADTIAASKPMFNKSEVDALDQVGRGWKSLGNEIETATGKLLIWLMHNEQPKSSKPPIEATPGFNSKTFAGLGYSEGYKDFGGPGTVANTAPTPKEISELEKFNDAWNNIESLGKNYLETLKKIDAQTATDIEENLRMGATVEQVYDAYHLITNVTKDQVKAVKEKLDVEKQVANFEQTRSRERLKELDDELKKDEELYKVTQDKNRADNKAADTSEMARYGMVPNPDIKSEDRFIAKEAADNPLFQYQMKVQEILMSNEAKFGMDVSKQIAEAGRVYVNAINQQTQAANEGSGAAKNAADAMTKVSGAATGLASSLSSAASAASKMGIPDGTKSFADAGGFFTSNWGSGPFGSTYGAPFGGQSGVVVSGGDIPSHADGGPTKDGLANLHDGEYVIPKNGALVMSGGGGVTVNMSGILLSNDPASIAMITDMIETGLTSRARQGRKLPLR